MTDDNDQVSRRSFLGTVAFAVIVLRGRLLHGQVGIAPDKTIPERSASVRPTPPLTPEGFAPPLPPVGSEGYAKALEAYYEYRTQALNNRMQIFEDQQFYSRVVFGITVLLVLFGMGCAGLQFYNDYRWHRGDTLRQSGDKGSVIVASYKDFKISSPMLGLVIFLLTLGFFYLYLVYVLPITSLE